MSIECDNKHIDSSTNNEVSVPTKHPSVVLMLIVMSVVLKVGRVAIITRGRYAGKKVIPPPQLQQASPKSWAMADWHLAIHWSSLRAWQDTFMVNQC